MFLGWMCVWAVTSFTYRDAAADPERAARLNERALALLGEPDRSEAQLEEAVGLLREAHANWPDNATITKNLAYAIFQIGRAALDGGELTRAREHFHEAMVLDDGEPLYPFFIGYARYQENRFDLARARFQETIQRFPEDEKTGRAYEFLGDLDYREGEIARAIESWEHSLRLAPDNDPLRARLEKARKELEVEADFYLDSSVNFDIRYEGISEQYEYREEILKLLEDAYVSIGRELDHYPEARTQVILYTQTDFEHVTSAHGWVGGLFDGKIRLPIKNFQRERLRIRNTLRHEFVHVVVSSITNRCPIWLNEGLAQLVDGSDLGAANRLLAGVVRNGGSLPSPSEIPSSFTGISDRDRVKQLYAWSLSFTSYLKSSYGSGSLAKALNNLASLPASSAFFEVYQRTLDELYRDWVTQL